MKNVLITSIGSFSGKRTVESIVNNKLFDNIYGCDIYPKEYHYISKFFTDVFQCPQTKSIDFFRFVNKIIENYNISYIIPLTDIDVDFFNANRHYFNNKILIPSSDFLSIARDKWMLNKFLLEKKIPTVKTVLYDGLGKLKYPIISKPRNGRSSQNIFVIQEKELNNINYSKYTNHIYQEMLDGEICTVDVLRNNNNGKIVCISRKEVIRTVNGAGMSVMMFYDEKLDKLSKYIVNEMKLHGVVNMEYIYNGDDYYLIDINPRYSAGIGFSMLYGYDIVKNSINLLMGEDIDFFDRKDSIVAQKIMEEVIIINGERGI